MVAAHAFVDRQDATPVVFDPSDGCDRRNRRRTLLGTDPANQALPLAISSPEPGHAPTRPLARCSATRRSGHRTALPDEGSSLWSPSGGAPGVAPFAGFIPRAGGRAAQVRRLNVSDISVRPGPRVVRAFASAPIYFRRGDRPPVGEHGKLEGGRSGICWRRLLGFAPVCGPIRDLRRPRIDPALGFASCRIYGHDLPCIATGLNPTGYQWGSADPITSLRSPTPAVLRAAVRSYPLLGFRRLLPDRGAIPKARIARERSHPCWRWPGAADQRGVAVPSAY